MHEGRRWTWWSALVQAFIALALALPTAADALTQDVTGQFAITRTGLVLNRTTNTFDASVTLRNSSDAPVLGPIDVVVGGLPAGITLANKTGDKADGRPYVSPLAAGSLLAGGSSVSFVLKFANPARATFSSTLQILRTVVEAPANAPSLLSVAATGSASAHVIGRIDGAANQDIQLQVTAANTCIAGTLVNGANVGGTVTARTDAGGYFQFDVSGVTPGAFVTLKSAASGSPSSLCQVSSRDNTSWPKAFLLEGSTPTASDLIDVPGRARWYKFAVTPGQRIDIKLSGLPADYDLAAFKDIGQAFASQFNPATAGTSELLRLTAEYAPSTFSPSTFSPSTFSPSTFSPDAYSPSTFSPSTFSPSVFSPSTFSPSTFSPSTFSPSTFSPSTFSPSTFSPSTFSPSTFSPSTFSATEIAQAFSTAQTRSIVSISVTAGLSDESTVVNTWNRTGFFYVRVSGRGSAFDTSIPFTLSVTKGVTSCSGVTDTALTPRQAVQASGLKTVILTDSTRTALDAALPGPAGGTLRSRLGALAARGEIKGVVVDVAGDGRVGALRQQAASNPACPYAKNLVAEEIKGIVDSYRANPLQWVVLVGNDDAIPFFRSPDESAIGRESGYVPPVESNSPSEASLRRDFVLSQDRYGSKTSISLPWNDFPVPGLAVGRLVETPSEIAGLIDAYVEAGSVVSPRTSLVTGYDFLEDAAIAVKSELDAGTGSAGDALITPNGTSPQAPASWTATQLRAKLFGSRHDVIFLAGHFSANSALAADFATSVLTTDLVASTTSFTNSIVFSAGCHAGYNLVDGDAIAGVTLPLDWAQAFARKQATLVAGTGYQYGDTDFLEYNERLYNNFARQLRAGPAGTPVTVGEALVQAKLAYLAATPDIRGLHEKALLEATLFGLPMLGVNMPAGRGAIPGTSAAVSPTPVAAGPAASLGLQTYDLGVAPNLTTRTQTLTNLQGGPTIIATWLSGPDGVVAKPGEPALPLAVVNVTPTVPSIVLRGIGYRGGSYVDTGPLVPFTGAATTESRGVHVAFLSPVFYPSTMWTPNYFGALAGNGGTQLLISPVQYRAASVAQGTSTQRRHTGMNLRLFYSGNLSQAALSDAPSIVAIDAQQDATGVTFSAQVVGDPAAAIYQVWVTYTGDGMGSWTPVDLSQCVAPLPATCASEDSRVWRGRLVGPPANLKYFVQAVNGVGLVSRTDNAGAYFGLASLTPAATTIALISPPSTAVIGDSPTVTAKLAYSGGVALAGKIVAVGAGGATRLGTTGSDGSVTVRLPVVADPGSYLITAAFAGDENYQPASISAPLTINRAAATPTVLPPSPGAATAGINITGALGSTNTGLQGVAVTFTVNVVGSPTPITVYSITNYLGNAIFPPPSGLPPGNYTVTQASFGGNGTFAPTTITFPTPLQVSVPKLDQSITFAAIPDKTLGVPDFDPGAQASSLLPVSYGASGACTVVGSMVHLTGIGNCTISADQPGNATYNPAAQVVRTFAIGAPAAAPTATSPVRALPSPTMLDAVTYTVTFSEAVTGVTANNFAVATSGLTGATVAAVTGAGATWTVSVDTGRGSGSLHLDLVNGAGITNAGGIALAGTPFTGETYQIDKGGTVIGVGAGRPVGSFGNSGYALFSNLQEVVAPGVAVLADGRILAAGGTQCTFAPVGGGVCALQLARYLATGAPDPSFGTNGSALTAVTNVDTELGALIVNSDDTFFVSGSRFMGTASVPFVAKFTSAGAPVAGFGTSGIASLDSLPLGFAIVGAAVDGSGRVVIASTMAAGSEGNDIFLTRLTSSGTIDTTFGSGGVARLTISTVDERSDRGTAVAVQPDGKIVVGGRTQVTPGLGFDFLLLRLDANGVPDPTFGTGGIATTRFVGTTGLNLGRKLVLQPDGKIVLVGGLVTGPAVTQCGIARFNVNGTLDATFGVGGQVVEPVTVGCFDVSRQADGKLVVVANDKLGEISYGTFLRLLPTGATDATFGTDGAVDISSFASPGRVAFTSGGNLVTSLVVEDPADGILKAYVVVLSGGTGGGGPNQPPIANAGPDQTVTAGDTVQLTSAGSNDPEGTPLSYSWVLTSRPVGSVAALSSGTAANPTFIADKKGTYVAELTVSDGGAPPLGSAPDTVEITATNRAPVAVGDSYSVAQGGTLIVNATTGVLANDTDADGDALSASLVATVGHGSLTLNPDGSFTYTPTAGYAGPDSFTYRVNDGTSNSNTATVSLTVTVVTVNHPPVANAGSNQNVTVGQLVQLNGSCTDVDGDATTPAWSFTSRPAGSNAALSNAAQLNPTFTPDLAGSYQLRLVCNDTHVDSAPSPVTITAATPTITVALPSALVGVGATINGTITLSAAAPAGGVQVTVASSNTAFATVAPSLVTIAQGATTGSFAVTGVAAGTTSITASATGYTGGSVGVGVTTNVISVGFVVIAPGQTQGFTVTLAQPAPAGGVTIALASGNTSVVTVPASVQIPAGAIVPAVNPIATAVAPGIATITGTATGYVTGTAWASIAAPVQWTAASGGNDRWYQFIYSPVGFTWQQAWAAASGNTFLGMPGYLATPTSQAENDFLYALAKYPAGATGNLVDPADLTVSLGPTSIAGRDASTWLGGSDSPTEGTWRWVNGPETGNLFWTGDRNGSAPPGAFTWWDNPSTPGGSGGVEPNNQNNEDFLQLRVSGGRWNDSAGGTIALLPGTNPNGTQVTAPATFLIEYSPATPPVTFTVTNNNDSGVGSLRDAIAQANLAPGPNTIAFAPSVTGTILLTSGQIAINGALTIVGPGANILTIDANGSSRIFSIFATDPACPALDGPDYLVSISGLRLTNARRITSNAGGAIFSEHSLALDSVIVDNNTAGTGGGVYFSIQYPGQSLAIGNSQFLANIAQPLTATPGSSNGGALAVVERCTGTLTTPVTVDIASSVFSGNLSQPVGVDGHGAAMLMSAYADVTITDTRIVNNHVVLPAQPVGNNNAGGLWSRVKSLRIERSEISDNSADFGAGLRLNNDVPAFQGAALAIPVKIVNSTISGNVAGGGATQQAGAIHVYGNVALELDNSTVSNNSAVTFGGGIVLATGVTDPVSASNATAPTLTLVSSIVANNSGPGGDIGSGPLALIPAFTIAASNSLVKTVCGSCNISLSGPGNLASVDPMLGPLAFNGGPTRTHALLAGSPAINTGSNPLALATDQRGIGNARVVGAAADMGAYEAVIGPSITLSLTSPLVGITRTINGTVTLSQPAPAGGLEVSLASGNTSLVTVAPSSVTIAAGSTTASFTVTGVALGGPVTLTASGAGFSDGAVSVTVTNALVSLGALPTIGLGQSVSLPVSLTAPAPAGGLTVSFVSSDPAVATVAASVFIAAGQTIPAANPQVVGVNIGSAQISASAAGFAPDARMANVQVSVTFAPTTLSVPQATSQDITVNISAPAPAGGLTVALATVNSAIATVASPITILQGQLSATAAVTGVAVGTTTLQATGSGVTSGTATINVTTPPAVNLNIGNQTIGKDLQVQPSMSLSVAAPAGGLVVTLQSSDASKVLLSTSATAAGSASITVTIPAGSSSSNAFFIQALSDTGTAIVTASATGYTTDTATITLAPSGFYNSSPGSNSFTTTTFSANTLFRVQAARLSAAGVFQASQDVRGGITVNVPVTVADVTGTNVGSITTSPVVFSGGDGFKDTAFHPISAGTAQITIGVPAGFIAPTNVPNVVTATVTAPAITIAAQTIGKDLQVQPSVSLGAPAPAGGLVVTLQSSDASKVLLSTSATTAGSASITVTIPAGNSSSSAFFIQALSDTGTATVTGSASGFATTVNNITLAPSGFYNSSPGSSSFTTTTFSANTLFRVQSVRLTAAGVYQGTQDVRGGITVNVPVTVADVTGTNVGSITTSPVVFSGGDGFKDTAFHPISAGTAQITIGVPAGFIAPTNVPRTVTATVTAPAITIAAQTIGKDLQVQPSVSLGAPAPAGGLVVTLQSSDASKVLLSTSATTAGSASITVTIPAGNSSSSAFFIQALSDTGTATVTGSASGFATTVNNITLAPSGFYNSSPGSSSFTTTTFSANTLFRVQAARLSAAGVFQASQDVRGGITVNVPVTVADVTGTNVGSITTSPVVFSGGDGFKDTAFHPISAGTAQITIGVPAGFIAPTNVPRTVTATVTAPPISMGNVTVGRDLQTSVSITLGATPPSPVTVTVTVASGAIALVGTSQTVAGTTTVTFSNVTTTSVGTLVVQGIAIGSTQVTVQAPGYSDDTSTVTVTPAGFYNSSPGSNSFTTTTFSANTLFRVQAARLSAAGVFQASQDVRGGITVNVPVTVADVTGTNVGSITISPVVFSGGDGFKDTAFDPISAGTAQITIGVPAGFIAPTNVPNVVTATVTAPAITIAAQTIGKDLQVQPSVSLGAPAPAGGLVVTLTSSDASKVLLSTSATTAGSASITVTIPAGNSSSSAFFIQALSDTGTATVTGSASGFATTVNNITLAPSGFYNSSPGSSSFTTTTFSANTLFRVQAARLSAAGVFQASQDVRGGITVNVPVTVADVTGTNVGSITTSPVVFSGGDGFKDTAFDPISAGTAQITIGVPAGFIAPSNVPNVVTATVTAPAINLANQTIGRDLQVLPSVSLAVAAPAGGLVVTLTSSDASKVVLSTSATAAGSPSITVTIPAGNSSASGFAIQALSDTGSATITATATAFASDTATMTLTPSGFVNTNPGGNFTIGVGSANRVFTVQPARLDATFLNVGTPQQLRGGIGPVIVPVTSGTPTVGTITVSPLTFSGGDSLQNTAFDPLTVGTTVLTVGVPAGFATPSNQRLITATVN